MAFSLDFRVHSEVGRIRKNNQDAAFGSPNLLVVADGMGGAAAGDLASAVAATEARSGDRRLDDDHLLPHMAGIMQRANDRMADLIEDDPQLDGMGTTFSGAAFSGTTLGIAHIGDSRGYLLREGELKQLTHDHSWVQALIDEGRLTPEQALTHPHRSLILRVLNGSGETEPDFFTLEPQEGDVLLFCSDGLSGMVSDEVLATQLAGDDLDAMVTELTRLANEHGGHDNISLVVARVVPQSDELDQAPAVLAGSATERVVPLPAGKNSPAYPVPEVVADPDHNAHEQARYSPRASKPRWPTALAAVIAVLFLVTATLWGIKAYASSQYFIAEAEGRVGIYNGLPGALLGIQMNQLVERRDTLIADLPVFYQRQVGNTIAAAGLEGAYETAEKLDEFATRCAAVRAGRLDAQQLPPVTPGEAATTQVAPLPLATQSVPVTPVPTGHVNYPTVLAPLTPTADEEADPEAC